MAGELAMEYGYSSGRPSALLSSIFMTTVNTAAKTLVAVASSAEAQQAERWKAADHMRFMLMMTTWMAVWVLRVLMDNFPCSVITSSRSLLHTFSSSGPFCLPSPPLPSTSSSLDLVLHQPSDQPSAKALGRALSHIFALLNEIPASSRKYQFALAMADRIVDQNSRTGHVELIQINRAALASAFARTSGLLYRSLQSGQSGEESGAWTSRVMRTLPMASYLASTFKGLRVCLGVLFPSIAGALPTQQIQRRTPSSGDDRADLVSEKYAQELLWITNKLIVCGAVEEALMQWSLASGLASLALTANPRVQGFILKISAILIGELGRSSGGGGGVVEVGGQVKYRLLALWVPLFCYGDNGLSYPVLSGYEKAEVEKTMDEVISTLPAMDQELILSNWLQDFSVTTSDWPNLQISYDRWCHSTRKLLTY